MNEPFILERGHRIPSNGMPMFTQIWRVDVDTAYQVARHTGLDFYGIFITSAGNGVLELTDQSSTERIHLTTQSAIIVPPHRRCRYATASDSRWRFHCVEFEADDDAARSLQLPILRLLSVAAKSSVFDRCDTIIRELSRLTRGSVIAMNASLLQILITLIRHGEITPDSDRRRVEDLVDWIGTNMGGALDVASLADRAGVSERRLYQLFHAHLQTTPHQYVTSRKLHAAAFLLRTTNLTVGRIAARLGFSDQFHLSRLFRARYGEPPSHYRRSSALS